MVRVDILNKDTRQARAIVPDDQASLAIGKEAQNVRLAAKLTGWSIDIRKVSEDTRTVPTAPGGVMLEVTHGHRLCRGGCRSAGRCPRYVNIVIARAFRRMPRCCTSRMNFFVSRCGTAFLDPHRVAGGRGREFCHTL